MANSASPPDQEAPPPPPSYTAAASTAVEVYTERTRLPQHQSSASRRMTCVLCKWDVAYEPSLLEVHLTSCEAYARATRLEEKRRARLFSLLSAPIPDKVSPEELVCMGLSTFDSIRLDHFDQMKPMAERLEALSMHCWHQYQEWREVMETMIAQVREKGHSDEAQQVARALLANPGFSYGNSELSWRVPGGQQTLSLSGLDPLKIGQRAREMFGDPPQHANSSSVGPVGNSQPDLEIQELRHQNELYDLRLQHASALEAQREEAQDELRVEREQNRAAISELREKLAVALDAAFSQLIEALESQGHEKQRQCIPEVIITDAELLRGQLGQLSRALKEEQESRGTAISEILSRDNTIEFFRSEVARFRELYSNIMIRSNQNVHAGAICLDKLIDSSRRRPHMSELPYLEEEELGKRLRQYKTGVMDGGPGQITMLLDEEKQTLLIDLERAKMRLRKAASRVAKAEEEKGTAHRQLALCRKELESANTRVVTGEKEMGTLRDQLEHCRRELRTAASSTPGENEGSGSLREELEQSQKELKITAANVTQANRERDNLHEQLRQSQKERGLSAACVARAEEEKASLQEQLEQSRGELRLTANRLAIAENERGVLHQQLEQCQEELNRSPAGHRHEVEAYEAARLSEVIVASDAQWRKQCQLFQRLDGALRGPMGQDPMRQQLGSNSGLSNIPASLPLGTNLVLRSEAQTSQPKSYQCNICQGHKGFRYRRNLQQHQRTKHLIALNIRGAGVPKKYWCSRCKDHIGFTTKGNMLRHQRSMHAMNSG